MAESKIGTNLKAYCSNCRGERNCEIKGHHAERGEEGGGHYSWYIDWYLLVCRGCEHVFAQSVRTNSEEYYQEDNGAGDFDIIAIETVSMWPSKAKRERPEWLEHRGIKTDRDDIDALDEALFEVYGALDHDLNALASIGVRTAFDVAAELLGIDPDKPFKKKLEVLVSEKLIKESEKEHLDFLVDAGSASAHRGFKPTIAVLDALMDTLESFIYDSFVLPAKMRAHAKKVAKAKEKVPPRKSKTKSSSK